MKRSAADLTAADPIAMTAAIPMEIQMTAQQVSWRGVFFYAGCMAICSHRLGIGQRSCKKVIL